MNKNNKKAEAAPGADKPPRMRLTKEQFVKQIASDMQVVNALAMFVLKTPTVMDAIAEEMVRVQEVVLENEKRKPQFEGAVSHDGGLENVEN